MGFFSHRIIRQIRRRVDARFDSYRIYNLKLRLFQPVDPVQRALSVLGQPDDIAPQMHHRRR